MATSNSSDRVISLPSQAVVYGAGGFGLRLAEALQRAGTEVVGFLDRSGFAPTGYARMEQADVVLAGLPVFIGISSPGIDIEQVSAGLAASGVVEIWNPVMACKSLHLAGVQLENYWMVGDVSVYSNFDQEIQQAAQSLADERSVGIFQGILSYRSQGILKALPKPDPLEDQYLPKDVPFLSTGMRFVDIGAFDGDTVKSLKARGTKGLSAILCLEPDPSNFSKLSLEVRELNIREALALPLALGDATETLRFNANSSASASRHDQGSTYVQSVRFDDLAPGWNPTHIKMDVEGAELEVLYGMEMTIQSNVPALAISIYHEPVHHWSILKWIKSLNLGYEFYVRVYGHQTFDTVLYCVPPSGEGMK